MRHAAQSPTDNRFIIAQRGERLHIEQLNPAGLKQRGKIARTVIGRKDEWTQWRHLAGGQRALKFPGLLFFFGGVNFSALNSLAQGSLERCQDLIAPFRLLLMLLITVEPECCVNSDKDENQFRCPADQTRAESFSLLFHRPIFSLLQRLRKPPGNRSADGLEMPPRRSCGMAVKMYGACDRRRLSNRALVCEGGLGVRRLLPLVCRVVSGRLLNQTSPIMIKNGASR